MFKMDDKDHQIIRELQKQGRLSNQELAERVNLSPSPCLRRVRILEENGILGGYAALVDQDKVGLAITAFVRITLTQHNEETTREFERQILLIDEVMDCHVMAGGVDYLLRVLVADLASYEKFVRQRLHPIRSISSIDTGFSYGIIKQSKVFPRLK